ncbi:putative carboxypeptidase C [Melampsora americana]|nr:putative carboxypeptidase C [Melampsora americana]
MIKLKALLTILSLSTLTFTSFASHEAEQLTFNSPIIQETQNNPSGLNVQTVNTDGIEYQRITLTEFPNYAIRLKSPQGLCDPSVQQYSGYLDISESKHLFFWFFESRNSPESDPLVLWLNGGPGCSSSTGLLFELGPCNVANGGEDTKSNPHSWNNNANIIFLDQPVKVGYSYTDEDDSINNSLDAAKDVYGFLQLFYNQFPKYSKLEFSLAAESYGGTYAPNIASILFKMNLELKHSIQTHTLLSTKRVHIPLTTVLIGNGLTDPLVQFASVPDYACAPSPYAIFDEETCASIRSKVPTCKRLQKFCYDSPSRFTCVPATLYCWSSIAGPIQSSGLNPYDVRLKCDQSTNPLCYEEMGWIETYMNQPDVRDELGVPASLKFESCNYDVNRAFQMSGDNMHNSAQLLPELLDNGIRLLIYAGEDDFMCNYLGNERWMLELDTQFTQEFSIKRHKYFSDVAKEKQSTLGLDQAPRSEAGHVGTIRSAGQGAGNYTFVSFFESGHMVPHDQPEVANELFDKWLRNEPLH